MEKKNQFVFYCFATIAYLAIAIYYICDGSTFIGCGWCFVSVLNFAEAIYLLKKKSSEKIDSHNEKEQ